MTAFGHPSGMLFPPSDEQLLASAECDWCDWSGTAFEWPLMASISVAGRRIETPLAVQRERCPACGCELDPRQRHPSSG